MQIEELLKSLELPKKYYDSKFDITAKYKEETSFFLKCLRKIDGSEFAGKENQIKEKINGIIPVVETNINRVLDVFKLYEGADPKGAQEQFDALMCSLSKVLFITTIDDWTWIETENGKVWTYMRTTRGRSFYRVRGVQEERKDIADNPDELFHIPLTKKALTNNERFSLAGFPALYLASMLPLAWQESGYPQKYYYSEYQYMKMNKNDGDRLFEDELKFLALYTPIEIYRWGSATKHNDFNLWITVVARCIMMYPLVLACAFVNHSGKGSYKQEYIIPQMLMQWVQRNNDNVQGISYFTCVDLKMMPTHYCAYNVVIPALPPYDDKKYSQKLRDEFTWTRPKFFEIPLFNSEENSEDRKVLYDFIDSVRKIKRYWLPHSLGSYIDDIERICVCLYHLMKSGSGADIQMIIHTLYLIDCCYDHIKSKSVTELLETVDINKGFISEDEFKIVSEEIKNITEEFFEEDFNKKGIAALIDKYKNTVWNDHHKQTLIDITYRQDDDIFNLEKWLHANHFIYVKHILDERDATYEKMKLDEIKTPLVKRIHSVSIYDKDSMGRCDYSKQAFSITDDGDDLLKS